MASLLENTSRIANASEDIKTSLLNKGAEFLEGEKIDTYSSKIDSLNVIQPGNYNVECYIRIDDVLVGEGIEFNVVGTDGTTQTATSRSAGFIYLTLSYGVGYDIQPVDTEKYYANSHELIYHIKEDGNYFATDYYFYTAGSGEEDWEIKECDYLFNNKYRISIIEQLLHHVKQPTNTQYMFNNCTNLTSLDVSNFDTSKVTNMKSMFSGCTNLTSLDVSNFDTSKVTNMDYMFYMCDNLKSIDISNFDTSKATDINYMFGCSVNLESIRGFSAKGKKGGTLYAFYQYGNNEMRKLKHFTFKDAFFSENCTSAITINLTQAKVLEEGDETTGVVEMFNSLPENTTSYTHIIKLYTNVYNLLSDETKAIATNKGYSLVYGVS